MRTTSIRAKWVALACTALIAVLSSCSQSGSVPSEDSSADEQHQAELLLETAADVAAMVPRDMAAKGTLRVGVALYSPPSVYYQAGSKQLVGVDVEVARALAQVMGLPEVEFVPVPFNRILERLGDDYDIAASIISVTSERLTKSNFVTYAETGSVFVTKIGNPHKFDPQDVCGEQELAESNTVQLDQVELVSAQCVASKSEPLEVITEKTIDDEVMALRLDRAPAAYLDSVVADHLTSGSGSRLVQSGTVQNRGPVGVAVDDTNAQLTVAVQAAMQLIMDEGILEQILKNYGVAEAALSSSSINPRTEW